MDDATFHHVSLHKRCHIFMSDYMNDATSSYLAAWTMPHLDVWLHERCHILISGCMNDATYHVWLHERCHIITSDCMNDATSCLTTWTMPHYHAWLHERCYIMSDCINDATSCLITWTMPHLHVWLRERCHIMWECGIVQVVRNCDVATWPRASNMVPLHNDHICMVCIKIHTLNL